MEKEFYQLYNLFLNQKEIYFDDIINQGYNEEQIEKLLHKEKLKLRKNNQYLLLDDSGLYEYATYLIKNRNFEDAKKALNMILIINPDHVEAKFNLSLYLVDNKQYQEAISLLNEIPVSILERREYADILKNINYLMFLINCFNELPEAYQKRIKEITLSQILHANDSVENKRRSEAFNLFFSKAMKDEKGNIYSSKKGNITFANITNELISINANKTYYQKKILLDLLAKEKYDKLLEYYEITGQKRNLSPYELQYKKIVELINNSIKNNILINNNAYKAFDINEAFANGNYILTLKLHREIMLKKNKYPQQDFYYLLLKELVKRTDQSKTITGVDFFDPNNQAVNTKTDLIINQINETIDKKEINYLDVPEDMSRDYLFELIESFDEVELILLLNEKYIIRYINKNKKYAGETIALAKAAYREQNYREAIALFKDASYNFSQLKPFVYYFIGMSYYKLEEYNEAYKYFSIGQYHPKRELDTDYTKILDGLMKIIQKEEGTNQEEEFAFEDVAIKRLNILSKEEVENIVEAVLANQKKLEEILQECHVSEEEKNMIRLIVAKELLIRNKDKAGANRIMQEVKKSSYKSPEVKQQIGEIERNRTLYLNK